MFKLTPSELSILYFFITVLIWLNHYDNMTGHTKFLNLIINLMDLEKIKSIELKTVHLVGVWFWNVFSLVHVWLKLSLFKSLVKDLDMNSKCIFVLCEIYVLLLLSPRVHIKIKHRCSGSNADWYRVNLKDDPRCVCGHLFEDAIHFLLLMIKSTSLSNKCMHWFEQ
jgi:hypothetical protein